MFYILIILHYFHCKFIINLRWRHFRNFLPKCQCNRDRHNITRKVNHYYCSTAVVRAGASCRYEYFQRLLIYDIFVNRNQCWKRYNKILTLVFIIVIVIHKGQGFRSNNMFVIFICIIKPINIMTSQKLSWG